MLAFLAASCGGSEGGGALADGAPDAAPTGDTAGSHESLPGWVVRRLAEPTVEDAALVSGAISFGTQDYAVGENRVSFVIIGPDNRIVQTARADVYYAHEDALTSGKAEAHLVPLGPHSHPGGSEPHDHPDATDLYVLTVEFPKPGRYWLVVEAVGEPVQAVARIDVLKETVSPPVGSKAIPSDNLTVADAPAEEITTARPPDTELLRYSVADSLKEGVPFVVVFATPKFCQSRTCGPTVEVVDNVRKRFAESGIRFIHVEIFEDNDPAKGYNRWVTEWRLPTEPWVFLVDGEGTIRAKFEGPVSVDELEAAIREHLLCGRTAPC